MMHLRKCDGVACIEQSWKHRSVVTENTAGKSGQMQMVLRGKPAQRVRPAKGLENRAFPVRFL